MGLSVSTTGLRGMIVIGLLVGSSGCYHATISTGPKKGRKRFPITSYSRLGHSDNFPDPPHGPGGANHWLQGRVTDARSEQPTSFRHHRNNAT